MKHFKNPNTSYWLAILAVVVLAGAAATAYVAVATSNGIKASLVQRTESMAELIPPSTISRLTGSEDDLTTAAYTDLKKDFIRIRESNGDIRFIYILALRDNNKEAFFYVDSEPADSEDYSPPGQSYQEGLEDVQATYAQKQSSILPVERDRWGVWLSAFSPIKNNEGTVIGVLGMDVPANSYYRNVAVTASVPFLLTLAVVMGLIFAHRRALQQQKYLNEKAFYLSFASHEIMSPLTSVSWVLRERRADLDTMLPKIQGAVSEVLTTVHDVLSLQNLDSLSNKKLQKEPEQISALIDTLITNLSIVCEEHDVHIENQTAEDDKAFTAPVDKLLFKRVVFNLLINAIKYSHKQGAVAIKLTQTANDWSVSVHNDGQHIPAEDQKRIFEGMYRTHSAESGSQQGIGLGLMLSHNIVVRHGGKLDVASAEGQGVTLTITVPKN